MACATEIDSGPPHFAWAGPGGDGVPSRRISIFPRRKARGSAKQKHRPKGGVFACGVRVKKMYEEIIVFQYFEPLCAYYGRTFSFVFLYSRQNRLRAKKMQGKRPSESDISSMKFSKVSARKVRIVYQKPKVTDAKESCRWPSLIWRPLKKKMMTRLLSVYVTGDVDNCFSLWHNCKPEIDTCYDPVYNLPCLNYDSYVVCA